MKKLFAGLGCLAGIGLCLAGSPQTAAANEGYSPNLKGQDTEKWILNFQEEFDEESLDPSKFSDVYLPHWSNPELVKANYSIGDGKIRLLIDQFQPGWMENTNQQISSIQTGMKDGLHIWDSSLGITGHTPAVDNYATKYGYFELRAKAQKGGGIHSAWWMIGTQNQYDKSAEVDIFEILGKDIHSEESKVWVTLHPWYDTVMRTQRLDYWVDKDISEDYHTYGFEWMPDGMKWYFDGELVRQTNQSPDYSMYTLLGIYQSWGGALSWQGAVDENQLYPKSFDIDYFRVYKTQEMLDQEAQEEQEKAELAKRELAVEAIFGGDFTWDWYHQPGHLNDQDMGTTLQSQDGVTFPVHLYVDWKEPKTINGMSLYTTYGMGQGITDFFVEYQDITDGSWKEAAKVENYQWQSNSAELEENRVAFSEPIETTAVRIKVLNANLQWGHFAMNEVKFWNH